MQALFHLAERHIAATIRPVLGLVQMEELEKWLQPDLPQNLPYSRKEAQHSAGSCLISGAAHGDGFRRLGAIRLTQQKVQCKCGLKQSRHRISTPAKHNGASEGARHARQTQRSILHSESIQCPDCMENFSAHGDPCSVPITKKDRGSVSLYDDQPCMRSLDFFFADQKCTVARKIAPGTTPLRHRTI